MNNKGFSLIELMGVIILLSLISLLVVPSIDRSIKNFKNRTYDAQIEHIALATRDWALDNVGKYSLNEGDTVTIILGQLKMGGYLDDDFENPNTKEPFPDDMQINIVRESETLKYYVLDTTGSATGTYEGAPTILLNGPYIVRLDLNSIYTELGVTATTSAGVPISAVTIAITDDGSPVGSVVTTSANTYVISYTVTDNSLTRTIYRTVIVN
jgi:prepilin-type N-terminal cleavage/methylation domain-containing protein